MYQYLILSLLIRNGYGVIRETVLISDGAKWIKNFLQRFNLNIKYILDLFHLKENVYTFSKFIFGNKENEYKCWAENMIEKL